MLNTTCEVQCLYEGVIDNNGHMRINNEWYYLGEFGLLSTKIKSLYPAKLTSTTYCGIVIKVAIGSWDIESIQRACFGGSIKVLHLVRPLHEQLISRLVASNTGIWHLMQNAADNQAVVKHSISIEISKDTAETECRRMVWIDAGFVSLSSITAYSRLSYESAHAMFAKAYLEVTDNSDVPFVDPQYCKTIDDHSRLVSNWSEIAHIFHFWETKREHIFREH